MNLISKTSKLYIIIIIGAYFLSTIFIISGIIIIFKGATGNTEFNLFGQNFKSTNVGITSIFIGAVTIILLIRNFLSLINKTVSKKSKISNNITNSDDNEKLFINYIKPVYEKFEIAHNNYIKTLHNYRNIISKNKEMNKNEIAKLQDLILKDSNCYHDFRFSAIQEVDLLKNSKYNFDNFIFAISDYFRDSIKGNSGLIKYVNRLESNLNIPRNSIYMTLEMISKSLKNDKIKTLITIDSIDDIINHLQSHKKELNKQYLLIKKDLIQM